ncbi:MAG: hypothetical protein K0Q97_2986 [Bacillota bacterium]|jgi:hypothetical protein|nr:hypothetical protein [Bacillota bacterium]
MNKHKKFMLNIFLSLIGITIIYTFLIFNYYTTIELLWVNSLKEKKDSYAAAEDGNKIIFTSGSNTLFGVRTSNITEELGIPTYNLAIHAALGIDFILEEAKEVLRSGDTVIIPMEYAILMSDEASKKLAFDYYRLFDKNNLNRINSLDKMRYVFQNNPINALEHTALALQVKDVTEVSYKSSYVNGNGDQTKHYEHSEEILRNVEPIVLPDEMKETVGLKRIKEFNIWCNENNITFYFMYPSTILFDEYYQKPYSNYFNFLESYFSENNISVIGSPYDSFYDISLFHDTNYHLNEKGMTIRTEYIIKQIDKLK